MLLSGNPFSQQGLQEEAPGISDKAVVSVDNIERASVRTLVVDPQCVVRASGLLRKTTKKAMIERMRAIRGTICPMEVPE